MKQKLWITLPKKQNEFDEWARWVEKGLLKVKLTGKFSGSVPAMLFTGVSLFKSTVGQKVGQSSPDSYLLSTCY